MILTSINVSLLTLALMYGVGHVLTRASVTAITEGWDAESRWAAYRKGSLWPYPSKKSLEPLPPPVLSRRVVPDAEWDRYADEVQRKWEPNGVVAKDPNDAA